MVSKYDDDDDGDNDDKRAYDHSFCSQEWLLLEINDVIVSASLAEQMGFQKIFESRIVFRLS